MTHSHKGIHVTDSLQTLIDAQSDLQHKMPTRHPTDMFYAVDNWQATDADRAPAIDFIHWNVTALTDELHELLAEVGWKPWAKSRHINLDAARGEAIDALHFLLNLFLVLGLDSADVQRLYHAKHAKNAARQEAGYDGVSTKCPRCNRALDDDAVHCERRSQRMGGVDEVAGWYCDYVGRFIPDEVTV